MAAARQWARSRHGTRRRYARVGGNKGEQRGERGGRGGGRERMYVRRGAASARRRGAWRSDERVRRQWRGRATGNPSKGEPTDSRNSSCGCDFWCSRLVRHRRLVRASAIPQGHWRQPPTLRARTGSKTMKFADQRADAEAGPDSGQKHGRDARTAAAAAAARRVGSSECCGVVSGGRRPTRSTASGVSSMRPRQLKRTPYMGAWNTVAGAPVGLDAALHQTAGHGTHVGHPRRARDGQWGISCSSTTTGSPRPRLAIAATPSGGGPETPTCPQGVARASRGAFEEQSSLCTRWL